MTKPIPPMPKTIKVGPFLYVVKVGGKSWTEARLDELAPFLLGRADHKTLTINVSPELSLDAAREVLLHEVLHACFNAVGQPLESMSNDTPEENAVRVLAPVLLCVLRDNGHLVDYLLG